MVEDAYKPGTFQRQYLALCSELGEPLNDTQIGALETTISKMFGSRSNVSDVSLKPFDREFLFGMQDVHERVAASIYQHLEDYVRMKEEKGPRDPIEVTESDALEFYQRVNPPKGVTGPHVRGFGKRKIEILAKYLVDKQLIEETAKAPE